MRKIAGMKLVDLMSSHVRTSIVFSNTGSAIMIMIVWMAVMKKAALRLHAIQSQSLLAQKVIVSQHNGDAMAIMIVQTVLMNLIAWKSQWLKGQVIVIEENLIATMVLLAYIKVGYAMATKIVPIMQMNLHKDVTTLLADPINSNAKTGVHVYQVT